MTQFSLLGSALPAWVFLLAWAAIAPQSELGAQTRYRVTQDENFRQQPGIQGRLLGRILQGTEVRGGNARDGWVEVVLEGFIWGGSVGSTDRDGYDLVVTARGGENLRAAPNGRVTARLASGFLLEEVGREGGWVRVRRTGWMWGRSLEPLESVVASTAGSASSDLGDRPSRPEPEATLDRAIAVGKVELRSVPDGAVVGSLEPEAPLRVLARSGEWVRVAGEGWVRETDIRPAAGGVLVGVSAAELRSNPTAFEGKLVQWTVQYLAVQTADELRREIPPGRKYLLARGPLPEAGFVYLLLDSRQAEQIEQLRPLAELVIIGRVKVARSRYLDNPVLELVDLSVRRP